MKKLTFTIGTQDAYTKEFYNIDKMIDTFLSFLDYATITKCQGCYKYKDGSICKEPSFKIEINLFDDDYKKQVQICKVIESACNFCNQESYLYEIQTSNSYNAALIYC